MRCLNIPFLANMNIRRIASLILSWLLDSLIQLLVKCSTGGHQILLQTTQSRQYIFGEVKGPFFKMSLLEVREGTAQS